METLEHHSPTIQSWRLLTTPPLSGEANMRFDQDTLAAVERGDAPTTLRLFRFSAPTLTYGRLQTRGGVEALIPTGWPAVQRPTGGGVVFHENDLCLSLCWPKGREGIPTRPSDQYRWIHEKILNALRVTNHALRLSACCDTPPSPTPFPQRQCFTDPVGYDIIEGNTKRVGGALRHLRNAVLYQGSIQLKRLPGEGPGPVDGVPAFAGMMTSLTDAFGITR